MAHYQFETLHPFNDGNGRIGRLLIVLHLLYAQVLTEPTLTVSPWFEARRADYYDALMAVSTGGDWDRWIRFYADGLTASARDSEQQLLDLLRVQIDLKARIRQAGLRADNAMLLVDFALAQPIFTVRQVERHLGVTYARANGLVGQLVEIGVLRRFDDAVYDRDFTAPDVLGILLRGWMNGHDRRRSVGSPEQPEHLLRGQAARRRQVQVGQGRGVHGVSDRGDAVADRMHGEAQVGAVPGRLLDREVRGDTGHEHRVDPALGQPLGQVVTREPGQLLVVDDAVELGQRRHLLDQLRARGVRPECFLGVADRLHERRVPDQSALADRHREPGEDHRHSGRAN